MKHKIFVLLGAIAALTTACDDTWTPNLEKEGTLRFSDMELYVNDQYESRAATPLEDYKIVIKKGADVVYTNTYAQLPEVITLPIGDYSVVAYSHEVQNAEWEHPYYLGSANFSISESKVTKVGTVKCKFSSIKVQVKLSETLTNKLQGSYKVVVKANTDSLVFSEDKINSASGYFKVIDGSKTLAAQLIATTKESEEINTTTTYSNVSEGNFYDLKYSASGGFPNYEGETGSVEENTDSEGSGFSINLSVTEEDENGNINISEEVIKEIIRPDDPGDDTPEDPDTPDDPSNPIVMDPGNMSFTADNDPEKYGSDAGLLSAIVNIKSPNGFQHLNVTINSNSANFMQSVSEMLPTQFDLVNVDEANVKGFKSLGFPVNEDFNGKTEVDFNITEFVPILAAFPGTHKFSLEVVDSENNSKKETLTFVAK